MANNVIVKNSSVQGNGVFASRDLKGGDFVLAIDDSHVVLDDSTLTSKQHAFDLDYLDTKIVLM